MQLLESGELQTLNGYPILDAGSAPILLNPAAGTPKIARDGMITQDGRNFGAIGLFTIEPANGFTRYENSAIIPANAGVPVVATRAGGIPELVEDEQTGLSADVGDAAKLAKDILRIFADAALRQRLSERAAMKVQEFTFSGTAAKTKAIYEEVLHS